MESDSPTSAVLVVADDPLARAALVALLEAEGHRVDAVGDLRNALEEASRRRPRVAVVDLAGPDASGPDLFTFLRHLSPEGEVVVLTEQASPASAVRAAEAGAFVCLVKPVPDDLLARTVAKALERAELARALRESEERYRLIMEHITDAVFLLDRDGTVVFANRRAGELTGGDPAGLLGRPVLATLRPRDPEAIVERLRAAGDTGEAPPPVETEVAGARWAEISVIPTVREGHRVGSLVVVRDVTERKRVEGALAREREAALQRERLATMGQLLAGVAHELNGPLSVLLGQTTLLREDVGGGPLAERAEKILRAASRCVQIVRSYLTMARREPPGLEPVSLGRVVDEAMELVEYGLRVDGIQLEVAREEPLPIFRADPQQLQQLVLNLVVNAQQALRQGPPPRRLRVTTRFDPAARCVALEVADTGPGIPPEVLPRIFEPFFTTKPPGHGTGLGLALCQRVAESHGGRITVRSAPGEGTVFTVTLPVDASGGVADAEVPAVAVAAGEPDGLDRGGSGGALGTVLVVDDDPAVGAFLREALELEGYRVDVVADGQAALDRLAGASYRAIVCDLRMPGLDGPALYGELSRRCPELLGRLLFLTGDSLRPETTRFLEQSGVPHLPKPVALDRLRRAMRELAGP